MILNVSGRCDIVAFYTDWFMKRYEEGFVDVRNPFYPTFVSRIYFENVDAIMFCTKNPLPILPHLSKIHQPILFHITLTPYKKDIEPNVIDKRLIIKGIKELSKSIPKENIYVRYDPIFISDVYTIDYHIRAFERMCTLLDGYVEHIIISFLDEYKNVQKNRHILKDHPLGEDEYQRIGLSFAQSAKVHGMSGQTCAEEHHLCEYGFIRSDCISKELAFQLTHKKYKRWNARGKKCNCVEMADIGTYNCCSHLCRYCYANYDESVVINNMKQHDDASTMLVGHLRDDDRVKVRK